MKFIIAHYDLSLLKILGNPQYDKMKLGFPFKILTQNNCQNYYVRPLVFVLRYNICLKLTENTIESKHFTLEYM